ncbi:MAG: PAS domain-containing protein [Acidobacteriaceae bacterium]|nr:PAS domain-containing protein [Acidobacteriaceae bacterium]
MAGLIVFEVIVLAVVSAVLIDEQRAELRSRTEQRLEILARALAVGTSREIKTGDIEFLQNLVDTLRDISGIRAVQITDIQGRTLVSSDPGMTGRLVLSPVERKYLGQLTTATQFQLDSGEREAVAPVRVDGRTRGYVWIYPDEWPDRAQLHKLLKYTLLSAVFGVIGCTVIASLMARSITRPLGVLMQATRRLIRNPEDTSSFPLAVRSTNEAADLTLAFNLMVASIHEQRTGLSDALALLDSMLANAPIGFAFFDRRLRFVRVNQFLAAMNGMAVNRHLGRTVGEVFAERMAKGLEESIAKVFEQGEAVQDLELTSGRENDSSRMRSWLANVYPVRTEPNVVRWVGVILVDTSERRRTENTLRKTEKLAAAGRLAATIAHEINNPLESITNLIFLIRQRPLDPTSAEYANLAQHELARVSEITQQMLRFYRQPTVPSLTTLGELLDSLLMLHQGRVTALHVEVVRRYEPDVRLLCFAGEMRQLFANLIGNALDAMAPEGGRLLLRVRNWGAGGVRVTVADTGSGMTREVLQHIFEPFFTTKEAVGTGLGLWVSAEIVSKHKGRIRVRSRVRDRHGRGGTVFMVFFPQGTEEKSAAEQHAAEQPTLTSVEAGA